MASYILLDCLLYLVWHHYLACKVMIKYEDLVVRQAKKRKRELN